MHYDVIIIGAGPAGCSAAINLQPDYRVAVIDKHAQAPEKIGESLPPASKRLLQRMSLWEDFIQQDHLPNYGNRASWRSAQIEETDFIRDIDGHGWHIDRAAFENWLREHAKQRQTTFYDNAQFINATHDKDRWSVNIKTHIGQQQLSSQLIIDASGRNRVFIKQQGIKQQRTDHMVCSWIKGDAIPNQEDAGFSVIQATENGWWYSAAVPNNQRILSFHTDSRLDTLKAFRDPNVQLSAARQHPQLASLLERCQLNQATTQGYTAAHSSRLMQLSGTHWLAVGDAAMSMDPISSQGMFNGLYSGLLAAEEAQKYLADDKATFQHYNEALEKIWHAYQANLSYWYQTTTQWPDAPFWRLKSGSKNLKF